MSNSDSLSEIFEEVRRDPFAEFLGIELLEIEPGSSRATMVLQPHMVNFLGIPHGGAIFSLADVAMAAAGSYHGRTAVGLAINIYYLSVAPVEARLIAEATEESAGRRTALYRVTVTTEEGQLVANAQGMAYLRRGTTT